MDMENHWKGSPDVHISCYGQPLKVDHAATPIGAATHVDLAHHWVRTDPHDLSNPVVATIHGVAGTIGVTTQMTRVSGSPRVV